MRKLAFVPLALLCLGAASPPGAAPAATGPKSPSPEVRPGEILLTPPARCRDAEPRRTTGQTLAPQRLDQLPQGNLSLAVLREVDGCPQSTVVREGYGAPAFRAEAGR